MKTLLKLQHNWRFRERGLKSLSSEFKMSKEEIKVLDGQLKEQWVKSGKARSVGIWLLFTSLGVCSMIVVGGYVRLTKSGLSMIKWDLHKIFSPSDNESWQKEFELYKQHPQFKNDFPKMNINEFKKIYLLEFYHRQLGKALGIIFVGPLLYFSLRGYLKRRMFYSMLSLLAVGSTQGFIGWWMVKSGLNSNLGENYNKRDVKVAPYRLAIHFTTAVILFGVLLSNSLFLLRLHPAIKRSIFEYSSLSIARHAMYSAMFWNFCTLVTGSLMAGNYAGKIINTFPKMGDVWVPNKFHYITPEILSVLDFIENQFIVHFNHRFLATFYIAVVLKNFYKLLSLGILSSSIGKTYLNIVLISILQYCLGIVNVLTGCKLEYAQSHQFIGIASFSLIILGASTTKKLNPKQMEILFKKLLSKDRPLLEKKLMSYKISSQRNYERYFSKTVEKLNLNC